MGEYSPIGAAIAWGRGAASKALAGTTMAATGGTGAVAAAGAGGGGSLASGGGMLPPGAVEHSRPPEAPRWPEEEV